MEERGSGGFVMDGAEPQLRSIATRSSSSQALLDSAPYSHCVVAAAAVREKAGGNATHEKAAMEAFQQDEELMMAGQERVVTVACHEKAFPHAAVADACGEHAKSSLWGYVGRLFHHHDHRQHHSHDHHHDPHDHHYDPRPEPHPHPHHHHHKHRAGAGKEADTSSEEDEEHHEEEKGQKKKRSSWLPDPDKRWPIQGFY